MSLPLHDLGSIKVSESAHSYLRARALKKKCDLAALVRELVEAYVVDEMHVATLAAEIHEAKGFGKIIGDCK